MHTAPGLFAASTQFWPHRSPTHTAAPARTCVQHGAAAWGLKQHHDSPGAVVGLQESDPHTLHSDWRVEGHLPAASHLHACMSGGPTLPGASLAGAPLCGAARQLAGLLCTRYNVVVPATLSSPNAGLLDSQLLLDEEGGGWGAVQRAAVKPAAGQGRAGGAVGCLPGRPCCLPHWQPAATSLASAALRTPTGGCSPGLPSAMLSAVPPAAAALPHSLAGQPLVVVGVEVGEEPVTVG
jgi:hypothetical protein